MKNKKIITIILTLVLAFNTSLCVLWVSTNSLVNNNYIKEKVYDVDIVSSINNSNDDNLKRVQQDLAILYTITDMINIDNEKVNNIINSKIAKDTLTKITINIYEAIKFDKEVEIISIDDYQNIVNDNIDYLNDSLKLKLDDTGKKVLRETLYLVGNKIIKDVPSTGSITSSMSPSSYFLLHILFSSSTIFILIIIELLIICIITIMYRNIVDIIRPLLNSIVISYFLMVIITGYLMTINNQYIVVNSIINDFVKIINKYQHILFYISIAYLVFRRRDIFSKKKSI